MQEAKALNIPAPPLSVCIPTYNNADMIRDSISSVLKQTYTDFELLVMDNCSTDGTREVVLEQAANDPRIKYFRHSINMGMAANFNSALNAARGDYVLILSADDLLLPDCLKKLSDGMLENPRAIFAACARTLVDESLRPLKIVRRANQKNLVDGETLRRECVSLGNRIGEPSAVLFKRTPASRGFDKTFSQFLDLEMWFYLLQFGAGFFLHEPLSLIRQHSQQMSKANFISGRLIQEKQALFRTVFLPANLQLTVIDKFMWDLRMVVSVTRFRNTGGHFDAVPITEVFYKPLFAQMLNLSRVAWFLRRQFGKQ